MKTRIAAICLCLFAGCVDGSDSDRVDETGVDPDKADDPEVITPDGLELQQFQFDANSADACDILPDPREPDGPCTYACDENELAQFVPPGSCMTFSCRNSRNQIVKTGACHAAGR